MQAYLNWPLPKLLDTQRLAESLARVIEVPMTVALNGELGTGKTQWARYFVAACGGAQAEVTSPTYVLMQRYSARFPIYHCDLYRLESAEAVWDLGVDELVEQPVVVLMEWASKFPMCLPSDHLEIRLEGVGPQRQAALRGMGPRAAGLVQALSPESSSQ